MSDFGGFMKNPVFWEVLTEWWKGLADRPGDRADLRRLRRPLDVFIHPEFQRRLLGTCAKRGVKMTSNEQERLALGCGVLSHVRELHTHGPHFARQLAQSQAASDDVRDFHFRKLLSLVDRDALYEALRRVVRQQKGVADLQSLVGGAFWWSDNTRREWAQQYYSVYTASK